MRVASLAAHRHQHRLRLDWSNQVERLNPTRGPFVRGQACERAAESYWDQSPAWPYTEGSRPVRALFCSSGDRPDRPRGGTEWSNPLRSRLGRPRMDPPSVASPHRNSRAVSRTASNDLESWRQVYALRALSGRYATHHVRITGLDQRLPRPPRRRR